MPFYELTIIRFNFVGASVPGPAISNVIRTFSLGKFNGIPFSAIVLHPKQLDDYTVTIVNS